MAERTNLKYDIVFFCFYLSIKMGILNDQSMWNNFKDLETNLHQCYCLPVGDRWVEKCGPDRVVVPYLGMTGWDLCHEAIPCQRMC